MHLPEKGKCPVRIGADALKQRFASMVRKKKSGPEKARKRLMRLAFRQTHLYRLVNMEVTPGFEPGNEGFADPCLTTWLCHRTVSPLVSILYETAFVKRETVFPAAFLLSASTDGGDAGKAPSRRTALALILHPAGCPAAPAHPRRCCRCRGCVPPGSSGSCLRRWLCPCRRRDIRRSRIGHG